MEAVKAVRNCPGVLLGLAFVRDRADPLLPDADQDLSTSKAVRDAAIPKPACACFPWSAELIYPAKWFHQVDKVEVLLTQTQVEALAQHRWTDQERTDHVLISHLYSKYMSLGDEKAINEQIGRDPAYTLARRQLFNEFVSLVWTNWEADASAKRNERLREPKKG